jgi:hypothetical protein
MPLLVESNAEPGIAGSQNEAKHQYAPPDSPRGLDTASGSNKIGNTCPFMEPGCEHTRTELIVRRDGIDYVRCLDCKQIFEAEDLESVPADDDEEPNA